MSLDALTGNEFVMGDHHFTLQVFADAGSGERSTLDLAMKNLNDAVAQARTLLADCGMTVAREDLALEAAYWAQLPGNFGTGPERRRSLPGTLRRWRTSTTSPRAGQPETTGEMPWRF